MVKHPAPSLCSYRSCNTNTIQRGINHCSCVLCYSEGFVPSIIFVWRDGIGESDLLYEFLFRMLNFLNHADFYFFFFLTMSKFAHGKFIIEISIYTVSHSIHTYTHISTLLLYSFSYASSLTHACIVSHPDIYVMSYINMQHKPCRWRSAYWRFLNTAVGHYSENPYLVKLIFWIVPPGLCSDISGIS